MSYEQLPIAEQEGFAAFNELLRDWELRLAITSGEEATQLAQEAVYELDCMWPFEDDICDVSGKAVFPRPDEDGAVEIASGQFDTTGYSRGFAAYDFVGSGYYRLYYKFHISSVKSDPHPVMERVTDLYAFFDTDSSIVPAVEVEGAVIDYGPHENSVINYERRGEMINNASKQLITLLRSTAFRRLSLHRQQQKVDGLLRNTDAQVGLFEAEVMLEADYCCRPQILGDTVEHEFVPIQGDIVQGTFLGFSTLERAHLDRKAIRRNADLVQLSAGLCMTIDVHDVSSSSQLRSGEIIMVPLSSQNPQVSFTETITEEFEGLLVDADDDNPDQVTGT